MTDTHRETYIEVSAVNEQVMQADAETAVTCCRCYDNDRPIRTVVKHVGDGSGKHCRDSSICNSTLTSNTCYSIKSTVLELPQLKIFN